VVRGRGICWGGAASVGGLLLGAGLAFVVSAGLGAGGFVGIVSEARGLRASRSWVVRVTSETLGKSPNMATRRSVRCWGFSGGEVGRVWRYTGRLFGGWGRGKPGPRLGESGAGSDPGAAMLGGARTAVYAGILA